MSNYATSKSIRELAKIQAKSAKTGHWLSNRKLVDNKYFDYISEYSILDLSTERLAEYDICERIVQCLDSILLYEEAYELVEGSALNFSCLFQVHDLNAKWKYIVGPDLHCHHYNSSWADIYNSDHDFEECGYYDSHSEDKIFIASSWASRNQDRLSGQTVTIKIVPNNALVYRGHRGLHLLKRAFGLVADDEIVGNLNIVKNMFNFIDRGRVEVSSASPTVKSSNITQFGGDLYGKDAILKAVAAKVLLKAMRPFIMLSSVWTHKVAWLQCLIGNLKVMHDAKVGVLCPNRKVQEVINERLECQYNVFTSRSFLRGLELDCLIVYQAHSIGVAEAIEWVTALKEDGCVILVGDPLMPNLRVHNLQVRDTCASVLHWFYNRDRYPEYFADDSPYVAHNPVCLNYNPVIFDFFNLYFYNGQLVNPSELDSARVDIPLIYKPIKGSAIVHGCSPYNDAEITCCLESIKELVEGGVDQERIGVLTTYCAQKKKLVQGCAQSYNKVLVGLLQDFENTVRPYLIISIVETIDRTSGGRRYLFSDLLYDKLCLNLALTRGSSQIVIIGGRDVLSGIEHWKQLLDLCESLSQKTQAALT